MHLLFAGSGFTYARLRFAIMGRLEGEWSFCKHQGMHLIAWSIRALTTELTKSHFSTLQEMYYLRPVDIFGGQLNRNVLVHFLTLGEFADAVMCDDFELGTLQPTLQAAVESYKVDEEIVILSKFRCGYLICVKVPLVPDFGICQALSVDYVGKDALQLNLDTT